MSITFYNSNTQNSACGGVISALAKSHDINSRYIFIAPDKFSLSIEKEIFEALNIKAAFNIDVVSFMRLAIKALGAAASSCLTKEGALLVFKKVLNRNAEQLTHYAKVARLPNFAAEMYAVITSFRNNCYSPEDILTASENLNRNTKKKALDIALLYKEYIKELENGYPDSTTRIDKFIEEAPFLEYIKGAHIYIGGFSTFSAKQYQIIAALMGSAKSVSIGVTPQNGGKNSFLYPFYTLERLKDLAVMQGLKYIEVECFEVLHQPFLAINRGLFAVSGAEKTECGDKFILFQENTVYDEINGIAKEIFSLVSDGGIRYKDIAVICCNSKYDELIRTLFARYNIPCFIDKKYRLKDALVIKHLISALDAVEYGFRQDKVINYVKNPLCGINTLDSDSFENYILERCTNYNGFLSPFKSDGCESIEAVRSKIAENLSVFSTKKQTGGEFARSCKRFLDRDEVKSILLHEIALTDDAMITASNLQSSDKLALLLDEIETLLGEEEYTFGECKNIFASCIEGAELSLIPQYADSVFVGSIKDSIYEKPKVIFVMAATGDTLPATHNYQAIISAKDSVSMEESGLRLYPSPPDLIKEEMFAILDLFTKATSRIYFGYSNLTPDGQQTLPSPIIAELKDITGAKPISLAQKHAIADCKNSQSLAKSAATQKNAFFEFLQLLPKATLTADKVSQKLDILYCSLSQEQRDKIDNLIFAPKTSENPDGKLYFNKDAKGRYLTRATQLETYFQCPYLHHLQQGLKLLPRKDGKLQRNNAGIVIHKVLELFFERTKGVLRDMSDTELQKISAKIINEIYADPKIVGESLDLFTRNSLESIRKECYKIIFTLAEKVKMSAYTPQLIEHSFGNNDELVFNASSDNTFIMRGKIDRVDTLQEGEAKKAIVIDYKTGSKSSSDAYFGNSLQLWMYLKALTKAGYEPEGGFYLSISDSPSKDDKPFLLSGYFNREELHNLDTGIYAVEDTKTVYSSTVNAGVKKGKITSKNALDKKTLTSIIDYNVEIARIALEEILAGNIEKSPQGENCERCACYLVCGGAIKEACRKTAKGKLPFTDCDEEVPDDQMD